jgi:hypothetical protein
MEYFEPIFEFLLILFVSSSLFEVATAEMMFLFLSMFLGVLAEAYVTYQSLMLFFGIDYMVPLCFGV